MFATLKEEQDEGSEWSPYSSDSFNIEGSINARDVGSNVVKMEVSQVSDQSVMDTEEADCFKTSSYQECTASSQENGDNVKCLSKSAVRKMVGDGALSENDGNGCKVEKCSATETSGGKKRRVQNRVKDIPSTVHAEGYSSISIDEQCNETASSEELPSDIKFIPDAVSFDAHIKSEQLDVGSVYLIKQEPNDDTQRQIKQEVESIALETSQSQESYSEGEVQADETDEEWKYCKSKKSSKKKKKAKIKVKKNTPNRRNRGRPRGKKNANNAKCEYCGKFLANMFSYSEHIRIHTGENPYKCTVCGKAFRTQGTVRIHQMIHDNNRPFECKDCGKRFLSGSLRKAHSRVHSSENSFKCLLCPDSFRSSLTLKRHILKHTGQEMLKCSKCCKKFFSVDELQVHKCVLLQQKLKPCKECGAEFKYDEEASMYTCQCNAEKVLKCSHCPRYFTSKTGRSNHLKSCVLVEKPYQCEICNRKFLDELSLKLHCCNTGNIHSKVSRPCLVCGLVLSSSSALLRHSVIHKLDKQFQCEECGKVFLRHDELTLHRRIHTGERPFVCKTCGKGFTISSSLIKHNRIHTKERPYKCYECDKTFICKSDLNRHSRFHTGVKPYKCHLCPVAYKTNRSLKDHVIKHHING